jgi:hypothetical protein
MASCQHRPHCTKEECLAMKHNTLMTRRLIQNTPGVLPFPGNDPNTAFIHQPPPYHYSTHNNQHPPAPYPEYASQPPLTYSTSTPIPIPQPPHPVHPMNNYCPPNAYLPLTTGQFFPLWIGNHQITPAPFEGPSAPMLQGEYLPGTQHPLFVTASGFSSVPTNRNEASHSEHAPIRTADGTVCVPQDREDGFFNPVTGEFRPHRPLRGGGGDNWEDASSSSDESITDKTGIHSRGHNHTNQQRVNSPQRGLKRDVPGMSEEEWCELQGRSRFDEDIRQTALLHGTSPDHVMYFEEPQTRYSVRSSRTTAHQLYSDAREQAPGNRSDECDPRPSGRNLANSRSPVDWKINTGDYSHSLRPSQQRHENTHNVEDQVSPPHIRGEGRDKKRPSAPAGNKPRYAATRRQRPRSLTESSDGYFDQDRSGIPGPSTQSTASPEPPPPQRRILILSRHNRLYEDERCFRVHQLNHPSFISHIRAHRLNITPAILEVSHIPYRLDD